MVEQLGFDSFWQRDHPARAPEDPITFLAAVAGVTHRVRLGTLVASAQYRHPLLLARVAADVDRLSNGRLVLGLGGGWDAREFEQMGTVLPPPRERLEVLEETIRILTGVWGDAPFTFEGKHLRVTEARVQPGPVQTPRVPLLIGAAASAARCAWWPGTPTLPTLRATGRPGRSPPRTSSTSMTSSAHTARRSADRTPRSSAATSERP